MTTRTSEDFKYVRGPLKTSRTSQDVYRGLEKCLAAETHGCCPPPFSEISAVPHHPPFIPPSIPPFLPPCLHLSRSLSLSLLSPCLHISPSLSLSLFPHDDTFNQVLSLCLHSKHAHEWCCVVCHASDIFVIVFMRSSSLPSATFIITIAERLPGQHASCNNGMQ